MCSFDPESEKLAQDVGIRSFFVAPVLDFSHSAVNFVCKRDGDSLHVRHKMRPLFESVVLFYDDSKKCSTFSIGKYSKSSPLFLCILVYLVRFTLVLFAFA